MNAFESALVAVMASRVRTAKTCFESHTKLLATDKRAANQMLGEVHVALLKLDEDLRCLQRLHDMAEELEEKSA